jgi:hypothetical protein
MEGPVGSGRQMALGGSSGYHPEPSMSSAPGREENVQGSALKG